MISELEKVIKANSDVGFITSDIRWAIPPFFERNKNRYPILYVLLVLGRTASRIVREWLTGNSELARYIMAISWGRIQGYLKGDN